MNFWQELVTNKKPILGLSPMDGVTDAPTRYMVAKYGKPDVIYTVFVSVDALHHTRGTGRWERVVRALMRARDLQSGIEKFPYEVAQIFGSKPELFQEAAELVEELGFDGVDINMGCPARKVSENGAGAGLIRTPELAREIIRVTKAATSLPVSVKTRIGIDSVDEMESWITTLVEEEPDMIVLHGRTLRQMYTGKADWEAIKRAGEIAHSVGIPILGNGDVGSAMDANEKAKKYGVDGVLIGRASFGNPGIFAGIEPTIEQRMEWMVEHARKFEEVYGGGVGEKWFLPMRKHLAWYARGFPGASELRQRLVRCSSVGEVERVVGS